MAVEERVDSHLLSHTIGFLAHDLLSFIFTHSMEKNRLKGKQSGKSYGEID